MQHWISSQVRMISEDTLCLMVIEIQERLAAFAQPFPMYPVKLLLLDPWINASA